MTYPELYRAFFETLFAEMVVNDPVYPDLAIAQCWYGEGRQVLGKQRSSAGYPVLWVERADYEYPFRGGNQPFTKTVVGAFMVLMNSKPDNYDLQNLNDDKCLRLCEYVLKDMLTKLSPAISSGDLVGSTFQLGSIVSAEHVTSTTTDNLSGRRVTFTIRGIQIPNLCC